MHQYGLRGCSCAEFVENLSLQRFPGRRINNGWYSKLATNTLKPLQIEQHNFGNANPKKSIPPDFNNQPLARSKRLRPTHSVSATFTESVGVRKPQPGMLWKLFPEVQGAINLEGHVQICF